MLSFTDTVRRRGVLFFLLLVDLVIVVELKIENEVKHRKQMSPTDILLTFSQINTPWVS